MAAPAAPPPEAPGVLAPQTRDIRRVFLADLHLDGGDGPHALAFRALLARLSRDPAGVPTELYILGDLFEFWEEAHAEVAARYSADLNALELAVHGGVKLFLLDGNRDFMYGRLVEERLRATLLRDGGAVELGDTRRAWLEHGDLLCTADARYLRYRRWVRSGPARLLYSLLPWGLARRLAGRVATRARADKAAKTPETFSLDLEAARRRLLEQNCQILLCGHTHRAQSADLGPGLRLLVLPAWRETQAGYRERRGALAPIRCYEDGTVEEAEELRVEG